MALMALMALMVLSLAAVGVRAQGPESVLAPGKVIQAHAKWEDDCKACHVRFDRNAQDRLCMDCHKEVGQDVRSKMGYHGRIKLQACRSCHTDHKGRNTRIVELDTRQFDHALSDYVLRGKHTATECAKCHVAGKKYRQTPSDCLACHRKDDVHKGSLGVACADCHNERHWKEARFDHDKTRFSLTGKHQDAGCADCHKNKANYKETPRNCVGCHKQQDGGARGHKGQFGERCDSCHGTKAWKPTTFNHDADTRYALRGQHRVAACTACHSGPLYKLKLSTECFSCHKQDDKHKSTLGKDCAACHTERDWKERARFNHDKTDFPLLGKHADIQCDACHKSKLFKEASKTCVGCHKAEDKHQGALGDRCERCHQERDWKNTQGRFDHDQTRFKLRNAHAAPKVACSSCHQDLRDLKRIAFTCDGCHRKDDRHEGQLGRECGQCHDDKSWKVPAFNHARTRFALLGRHLTSACTACHTTPRFKDASRDCYSCHRKDDQHKLVYGVRCDSCHNARAWSLWDFDHDRRSSYRLEGAHRKLGCDACHTRAAPTGKEVAPLGSTCIACHRKDDVHDGSFGPLCEQCHVSARWKQVSNRGTRSPSSVSPSTTPRREPGSTP